MTDVPMMTMDNTLDEMGAATPAQFWRVWEAEEDEIVVNMDRIINKHVWMALKYYSDDAFVMLQTEDKGQRAQIAIVITDHIVIRALFMPLVADFIAGLIAPSGAIPPQDIPSARDMRAELQAALELVEAAIGKAEEASA